MPRWRAPARDRFGDGRFYDAAPHWDVAPRAPARAAPQPLPRLLRRAAARLVEGLAVAFAGLVTLGLIVTFLTAGVHTVAALAAALWGLL